MEKNFEELHRYDIAGQWGRLAEFTGMSREVDDQEILDYSTSVHNRNRLTPMGSSDFDVSVSVSSWPS